MYLRIMLGVVALAAIGAAAYYFLSPEPTPSKNEPQEKTYTSEKYGLSFSYPEAYQLTEHDAEGSAEREHHAIVLINKDNLPLPENSDGPPAITIDIYQNNLDNLSTEEWIRNDSRSNFKLGDGTLYQTMIDGKQANSYRWDGLYGGTTMAIARPNWIYAFSVTYLQPGADIVQDFVHVRDTVKIR